MSCAGWLRTPRISSSSSAGNQYDRGIAVEIYPRASLWMYTTLSAVPAGTDALILVQVNDRPGNIAEVTEEKSL